METSTDCGCIGRKELLGKTFGRLTVKAFVGVKHRVRLWKCVCACGTQVIAKGHELKLGNTSSCGCWRRERIRAKSIRHGMSRGPEYQIWALAKDRCFNSRSCSYENYGGRGVTMCQEWAADFMAFYDHIGPRPSMAHSLDRINNAGNYEPGNVRWATDSEQQLNRRPFAEWRKKKAS